MPSRFNFHTYCYGLQLLADGGLQSDWDLLTCSPLLAGETGLLGFIHS